MFIHSKIKYRKHLFVLCILIILIIVAGIFIFDFTKVLEKPTSFVTFEEMTAKITEDDTHIYLTIYPVNGHLVKSITYEKHYQNKIQAIGYFNKDKESLIDAKIKDNIVYGTVNDTTRIGKSKQEILQDLKVIENIWNNN